MVGVYAVHVYKGQWDAAATANTQNAKNFKQGQRPWVGPVLPVSDTTSPMFDVVPGQPYKWLYHIKNYGISPALHGRGKSFGFGFPGNVTHVPWDKIKDSIEHSAFDENTEVTIFPGDQTSNFGKSDEPVPSDPKAILAGQYVVGAGERFEYSDEFGDHHTSTWCVYYVPPGGWHTCPFNWIAN